MRESTSRRAWERLFHRVGPAIAKRLVPKEAIVMRGMWSLFSLAGWSLRPGFYGWISSARYPGSDPLWARYVMMRMLYAQRSLILSQWTSRNIGVMWSDFWVTSSSHAPACSGYAEEGRRSCQADNIEAYCNSPPCSLWMRRPKSPQGAGTEGSAICD